MDHDDTTPHPPYDALRTTLGDRPDAHAALEDLRTTLAQPAPRRADVDASVERVRAIPELAAHIAIWWESPRTQGWIKNLTDAGL